MIKKNKMEIIDSSEHCKMTNAGSVLEKNGKLNGPWFS